MPRLLLTSLAITLIVAACGDKQTAPKPESAASTPPALAVGIESFEGIVYSAGVYEGVGPEGVSVNGPVILFTGTKGTYKLFSEQPMDLQGQSIYKIIGKKFPDPQNRPLSQGFFPWLKISEYKLVRTQSSADQKLIYAARDNKYDEVKTLRRT